MKTKLNEAMFGSSVKKKYCSGQILLIVCLTLDDNYYWAEIYQN